MPTQEKVNTIDVLKDRFEKSNSYIIADHTGINVADLTVLRRDLKKADAEFRIAKNTLLKIAAKETGHDQINEYFVGPTSMVFGFGDASVPAKILYEFAKKTDIPKVKAYVLENQLYTIEEFKRIAQLPGREQVLATLLGAVEGPIVKFINMLEGTTREFIGLVDALAEKKENE